MADTVVYGYQRADEVFRSASGRSAVREPFATTCVGAFEIALYDDFDAVEAEWRALEVGATCSAYQRFDFLKAWYVHLGAAHRAQPVIALAVTADHRPAFILPLIVTRQARWRELSWQGGKHSNYGMGLFAPGVLERLTPHLAEEIVRKIAEGARADAAILLNQPVRWHGLANPFAGVASRTSVNQGFTTSLAGLDPHSVVQAKRSAKSRKRLRWQRRKLQELGKLRYSRATSPVQAIAVLEDFFRQKCERFRDFPTSHPFGQGNVQAFLRDLACLAPRGRFPPLELHALSLEGKAIAVYGGAVANGRFSTMFNSFEVSGEAARYSPAELLVEDLLADLARRGVAAFDLGLGAAGYKAKWCDETEVLHDSLLGLTAKGRLRVGWLGLALKAKRLVKRHRAPFAAALRVRQIFGLANS